MADHPSVDRSTARQVSQGPPRLGLFGCPLDTGNNGVTALGLSAIAGIAAASKEAALTMFDYGTGRRRSIVPVDGRNFHVEFAGCYASKRIYRDGNLLQLTIAARLGLSRLHPFLRRMRRFDAILDISGGDSFSDIYGTKRFNAVTAPKRLALTLDLPLVLLPQTYGPFNARSAREAARSILLGASQIWARDARSYAVAAELLGSAFDPQRHHQGIDLAFGLPACQPANSQLVEKFQEFRSRAGVLAGLNVSGLLFNRPGDDQSRYGFRGSYRDLIEDVVGSLLRTNDVSLLLVPHVSPRHRTHDCDVTACDAIVAGLPLEHRQRVFLLPGSLGPAEAKWFVAACDWFCGTRMHACIGAISQAVPTAAIAYSDKTHGVFETAGAGDSVVDPRKDEVRTLAARIFSHFQEKGKHRVTLEERRPALRAKVAEQFKIILSGLER